MRPAKTWCCRGSAGNSARRSRWSGAGLGTVEQFHQLVGIAHRRQAQHKGVDKAEYRGIGADSEAEREQRDGGNPGVRRLMRKAKGTSWVKVARSCALLGRRGQRL